MRWVECEYKTVLCQKWFSCNSRFHLKNYMGLQQSRWCENCCWFHLWFGEWSIWLISAKYPVIHLKNLETKHKKQVHEININRKYNGVSQITVINLTTVIPLDRSFKNQIMLSSNTIIITKIKLQCFRLKIKWIIIYKYVFVYTE